MNENENDANENDTGKVNDVNETNDVKTNMTVKRSATREAVSAAFAQFEHDRQSFGTVATSRASGESLDISLTEYLDQEERERVTKLFAEPGQQ